MLEALEVVLEPVPRRLDVLEPHEGVASQQLCKVADSERDDQSDDCEADWG